MNNGKWETLSSGLILNSHWAVSPWISRIQVETINKKELFNCVVSLLIKFNHHISSEIRIRTNYQKVTAHILGFNSSQWKALEKSSFPISYFWKICNMKSYLKQLEKSSGVKSCSWLCGWYEKREYLPSIVIPKSALAECSGAVQGTDKVMLIITWPDS